MLQRGDRQVDNQTVTAGVYTFAHSYKKIEHREDGTPYTTSYQDLNLMVVLPNGEVSHQTVKGVKLKAVDNMVRGLRSVITRQSRVDSSQYESPSQELHKLFIEPILADLESAGVNNLTFSTDLNLQTISPAVLQNEAGEFLIEKFSVSVAPSLQTIEVDDYVSLKNADVLKMGATEFPDQSALPGVLGELAMVAEVQKEINPGENQLVYLNEQFTIENLEQKIEETGAPIVHLGTHGESFGPDTSYLVLGSEGQTTSPHLTAEAITQIEGLSEVELLNVGACKGGFGYEEKPLGVTGAGLVAGASSVLGSLWYVSDAGTMALMTELYQNLLEGGLPKTQALQQAQIAMIQKTRFAQDGRQLHLLDSSIKDIPTQVTASLDLNNITNLNAPYFWSGFALNGNPW
jgi:CHAT domain-containing protein